MTLYCTPTICPPNASFELFEECHHNDRTLHLKISNLSSPIWLSHILPLLENMGLYVISQVAPTTEKSALGLYSHDFILSPIVTPATNLKDIKHSFEMCLTLLWQNKMENDAFNSLIMGTGLSWRQVILLRAYYKYLRQIDSTYTLEYVAHCLGAYPTITHHLLEIFDYHFNPQGPAFNTVHMNTLLEHLEMEFDHITSGDQEKILRYFLTLILGTLRTNYYQLDDQGNPKDYISLKFDCRLLPFLPQPRPMYEIFVYAPYMEAIHLRSGKVSRGGIRWSDRPEDFRKEILDLMRAQNVKNAVIVPGGAKGGFIVKKDLTGLSFQDRQQEAIHCYTTMIQGMLDITDSIQGDTPVPPSGVKCADEADPYLVVAADKGTATFSDIANKISKNYGFWLGDAFASGGSAGYDHKAMGITARGAWESVKRHFQEMGHDINKDPFTVVGVGDMAGDVFGNGMLLSPNIKLVAAFNHQHIFIDPNPDTQTSFQERKRLFQTPGSTWMDYDRNALSPGGEIYQRTDKVLNLSPAAKTALGLPKLRMTPPELIKAILKSPVDLLWLGGIGTFVKATSEPHGQAGDRTNDLLRVNGAELQCKVIGEGANLGLTQKARIEYAQKGGRLNTDAIDNSAGVDCSDHEVNLKILLQGLIETHHLKAEERDDLLKDMTDQVTTLVLQDNILQNQLISLEAAEGPSHVHRYRAFIKHLEHHGRLQRMVENLPTDEELEKRETYKEPLTRPELAVMVAYGKIFTTTKILATHLGESTALEKYLIQYFPPLLQAKWKDEFKTHPLRRDIIATQLSNEMVNYLGPCFLFEMMEKSKQSPEEVIKTYLVLHELYNLPGQWENIAHQPIPLSEKYHQFRLIISIIKQSTLWFLHHQLTGEYYGTGLGKLTPLVHALLEHPGLLPLPADHSQEPVFLRMGPYLAPLLHLTRFTSEPLVKVANMFFQLKTYLRLDLITSKLKDFPIQYGWDEQAIQNLEEQFIVAHQKLTVHCLQQPTTSLEDIFHGQYTKNRAYKEYARLMDALQVQEKPSLSLLMALEMCLRAMIQG